VSVGAIALTATRRSPPPVQLRPAGDRPTLLLLTSLPLLFSDDFTVESSGSPALKALRSRYRVVPISVTDGAELAKGHLLLMAQPQAQTAENLVVLDQWIRRGGRLLLLADPRLEWPSKQPMGDLTRPPPMFMDTGLLAHWGLRLDAPDQPGITKRTLGGYTVVSASPGALQGACAITADELVASCRIGAGRAIVVADADLLETDRLGPDAQHNLDGLLAELATLEHS
jgi:hypothetical protein